MKNYKYPLAALLMITVPPMLVGTSVRQTNGIAKVEFFLDGQPFGPVVTAPPYTFTWDSTKVSNGSHSIYAKATDVVGTIGTSLPVSFFVQNFVPPPTPQPDPPPVIYFITKDGESFTGNTKVIDLHVADDKGVFKCELTLNNNVHSTVQALYGRLAAVTKFYIQGLIPKGVYTVGASCYDGANGVGRAAAIEITKK